MARNSIINVINDLISKRLNSLTFTDIVIGKFVSVNPYSITFLNELNEITIPEDLLDLDVIPKDVKVGDEYRFIRYNKGNRFLLIGNKISKGGD